MYELDTIGDLYDAQPPQMAGILDDVGTLLTGGTTGGIQAAYNAATGGASQQPQGPGILDGARKSAQDLASAQAQTAANIAKKGAELAAVEAKKAAAYALQQARAEAAGVKRTVMVVGGLLAVGAIGWYVFGRKRQA
jgi:hypothetical protein